MTRKDLVVRRIIYDFHPMWFVSTMGTGISSLVLYNFPYPSQWLRVCSYIMFAICLGLFLFLNSLLIICLFMYPSKVKRMFLNVGESVFFGCYSMGFSSIISYLHNITGRRWVTTIYTLWIINIAVSLFTAWCVTFLIHWKSPVQPHEIHISFLLPVVSQNVVAAIGGAIYPTLHPNLRLPNIIISYMCWANGIALTGWVVGVYFWKLYVYKIPLGSNNGFVAFLPVGAFGQGAYGVMLICDNFRLYLRQTNPSFLQIGNGTVMIENNNILIGEAVKYMGLLLGLFLVSNGYYFTFNAALSVIVSGSNGFTKAWWGCTFPLGTMALSNHALYTLFDLKAFRVVSTIYSVVLVLITISCLIGSVIYEFPHEVYRKINQEDTQLTSQVLKPEV